MNLPVPMTSAEFRKARQELNLVGLDEHIAARPKRKKDIIEHTWLDAIMFDRDVQDMERLEAWTKTHGVPRPTSLFATALSFNRTALLSWILDTQDWSALRSPSDSTPGPNRQDQAWLAQQSLPVLQQHWRQKTSLLDSVIVLMERFPDMFLGTPPTRPRRADEVLTCALDRAIEQSNPGLIRRLLDWMKPLPLLAGSKFDPKTYSHGWILGLLSDTNASRVVGLYNLAQKDEALRAILNGFFPVRPGYRAGSQSLVAGSVGDYLLMTASPSLVDVLSLPSDHPLCASVKTALADDACFVSFLRRSAQSNPGLLYRAVSRHKEFSDRFLSYKESSGNNSAHVILSARHDESLKQPWTAMDRWLLSNAQSLLGQPFASGQSVLDYCTQEHPLLGAKLRRHQLAQYAKQSCAAPLNRSLTSRSRM